MVARLPSTRAPGFYLQSDSGRPGALLVSAEDGQLWLRCQTTPESDQRLTLDWTGPGRIRLVAEVAAVSPEGADGSVGVRVVPILAASVESQAALEGFAQRWLRLEPTTVDQRGSTWTALFGDAEVDSVSPASGDPTAEFRGPPPKVAGQKADDAPAPPLDTGLPATTPELLSQLLVDTKNRVGAYLNVQCAYAVSGAQYWGRALKLNDRWLQVNTASVVPGMGVRTRVDLTLELDGVRRAVSVYGVIAKKQMAPPGSSYKASLGVRYNRIDEGDSPGVLTVWLGRHLADRASS